jgi:molybdopterin-containing oxidoreductase family iron-sulfur binding subunit
MSEQGNLLNVELIQKRLEKAKGPGYWRSLDELFSTDTFREYLHREFPRQASEWIETGDSTSDEGRRNFLKIMGASLALAGLSACTKQPTELIMPYVEQPEKLVPGKPLYYATAVPVSGIANPVLVETHDFRPTKVEGNPQHPVSMGGADVPTQAAVLGLYDPDRVQTVNFLGEIRSYTAFLSAFVNALEQQKAKNGAGIRILTETVTSPTLFAQMQDVLKLYPAAKWVQWEPTGHGRRMGSQMAFGQFLNPIYHFDQADVVVSIDANFLGSGPGGVKYARDWASKRNVRGGNTTQSRFYAVESTPTASGSKADHRLPVKPSEVLPFLLSLKAAVSGGSGGSPFLTAVAQDLQGAKGKSIVIAGEDQSPEVHATVHAINEALGNNGKTVTFTASLEQKPTDQWAELKTLVGELRAKQVDLLLIIGGNPVYTAPREWNLKGAIQMAKLRARVGQYTDDTSALSQWVIPEAHAFEAWSDAPAFDGTLTIMQPLISPLYGGKSAHDILNAFTETPEKSGYETLRDYWAAKHTGADFEAWWKKSIHDGWVEGSTPAPVTAAAKGAAISAPSAGGSGFEVSFHTDPYILDGRHGNNAWLQELPRPVTRLTWDNAVVMSEKTAKDLGVGDEDKVEISVNGWAVQGAIWRVPGQADGTVALTLGYGQTQLGRAANGAGFDANPLRTAAGQVYATGATIRKVGDKFRLAAVQHHFLMEGREPVKVGTLEEYKKDPEFAQKESETAPKGLTIFPQEWQYKGYAWGMAIDLTSCVGCNACVVACQSENNIAVVGKEQVLNTREMHWIRIDRYYSGSAENPQAHFQPVACQHCESAPCELVCPVAATEHDAEGLNNMVYNRCVGTRYCSNNCPYKVRRFNFLLFTDWETESYKLQRNPDVTVRSRGVMEKCTYCVQRINYAKITAEKQDRRVADGEIVPACAATCPSQAIMFGDLNDPNSKVSQWKNEKTNYSLLGELNTRPRTTYLAEVRNPNPSLEKEA